MTMIPVKALGLLLVALPLALAAVPATVGAEEPGAAPIAAPDPASLPATGELIRDLQMRLMVMDYPVGKIDGIVGPMTRGAIEAYVRDAGLPSDLTIDNVRVSRLLVDSLRARTGRPHSGSTAAGPAGEGANGASNPPSPTEAEPRPAAGQASIPEVGIGPPPANADQPPEAPSAVATVSEPTAPEPVVPPAPGPMAALPAAPAPPPASPPPDRYPGCPWDAADFHIGDTSFTPQQYLDTAFDGAVDFAVAQLTKRLQEARAIALRNQGPALLEVQRQSRVLAYFECRLAIDRIEGRRS